jgi:hypothetical protein
MTRRHPIQNVHRDSDNVLRFVENSIVRHLLDIAPTDLNQIFAQFAKTHPEDYEQLMQLIGYSLDGFAELCYPINVAKPCKFRTLAAADRKRVIKC